MKGKTAIMATVVVLTLAAFTSSASAGFWCLDACKCTPRDDFGRAFMMAKDGQIANPDAGRDSGSVEGIDGRAAVKLMQSYVDSFKYKAAATGGGITSFALTQSPGGSAP